MDTNDRRSQGGSWGIDHPPPPFGREKIIATYKLRKLGELAACDHEIKVKHGQGATVWIHPLLLSHPHDLREAHTQAKLLGLSMHIDEYWKRRDRFSDRKLDALKAMWRLIAGPTADIAVVPTGWTTGWFRGKTLVEVTGDGFLVRECPRWELFARGIRTALCGFALSIQLVSRLEK